MRVYEFMRGCALAFWDALRELPQAVGQEDRRTITIVTAILVPVAIVSIPLVVSVLGFLALACAAFYGISVLPARKSFEKRRQLAERSTKAAR